MSSCIACVPYIFEGTPQLIFNANINSYSCQPPGPTLLPILSIHRSVDMDPLIESYYTITIGTPGNSFSYSVYLHIDSEGGDWQGEFQNLPANLNILFGTTGSVNGREEDTPFVTNTFTLTANVPLNPSTYVPGDTYTLNIFSTCSIAPDNSLYANVVRQIGGQIKVQGSGMLSNETSSCTGCDCFITPKCDKIQVPRISIFGDYKTNIINMMFTICDELTYYHEKKFTSDNICAIRYIDPNQLKQTVFNQGHIPLELVVRGQGNTLYDKVLYLYNIYSKSISFDEFYNNIVLYGMVKYILARVLYGNFNLKYLLGKYNQRFMHDLGNSRFCNFINFFNDCSTGVQNYNKFFRSGKK